MNKEVTNPMPTLEQAKELCKHIQRPLGHSVILINSIAPMVTPQGIKLMENDHKVIQQQLNKKHGMLVVMSNFKKDDPTTELTAVYEGERVLLSMEYDGIPIVYNTTITSEELLDNLELKEEQIPSKFMYKKYAVICIKVSNIGLVINT